MLSRAGAAAVLFAVTLVLHTVTTLTVGDYEVSLWRFFVYFLGGSVIAVHGFDRLIKKVPASGLRIHERAIK